MSKATTAERALNRKGGTMSRLIKTLFGFYPVLLPLVVVGVVLCAIINSIGATFLQSALQIISESWQSGDWEAAQPKIAQLVTTLALHLRRRHPVFALLEPRHWPSSRRARSRSCARRCSTACRTCRFATSTRTSAATS